TNNNEGRVALVARPSTPEVTCLAAQIGLSIREREDIRVWEQSGVDVYVWTRTPRSSSNTASDFAEDDVLTHAADHGVPVPHLLTSTTRPDASVLILMEDLGEQTREPTLADAATAALAIHACHPYRDARSWILTVWLTFPPRPWDGSRDCANPAGGTTTKPKRSDPSWNDWPRSHPNVPVARRTHRSASPTPSSTRRRSTSAPRG